MRKSKAKNVVGLSISRVAGWSVGDAGKGLDPGVRIIADAVLGINQGRAWAGAGGFVWQTVLSPVWRLVFLASMKGERTRATASPNETN